VPARQGGGGRPHWYDRVRVALHLEGRPDCRERGGSAGVAERGCRQRELRKYRTEFP
jgi:hypothetical protein